MISRVILPLLVAPLLVFAAFCGLSYSWYHQTVQTFQDRSDQYRRLQAAKSEIARLQPLEDDLFSLKSRFNEVDNSSVLDAMKLYLSKNSSPSKGVKLEDYRLLAGQGNGGSGTFKIYGSVSLKFTCRSEALAAFLAEAMNAYPNLVLIRWSLEPNSSNSSNSIPKLLQFNSTADLVRINNN